jgi:hypothetical protein
MLTCGGTEEIDHEEANCPCGCQPFPRCAWRRHRRNDFPAAGACRLHWSRLQQLRFGAAESHLTLDRTTAGEQAKLDDSADNFLTGEPRRKERTRRRRYGDNRLRNRCDISPHGRVTE